MTDYLSGMNGRATVLSGDPPAAELDITKWSAKPVTPVATFGSSFNEGWKVGVPGTSDVTGTLEGKVPEDGFLPERGTLVALDLRVDDDGGETTLHAIAGQAVLGEVSIEVDNDNGEPVAWSASFESIGAWTKRVPVELAPIVATEDSGYIASWHADWETARAGFNLSLPQGPLRAYVYQPPYYIHRGFLQFDTAGLEHVIGATLRMTLKAKASAAGVQVGRLASPYPTIIPGLFSAVESAEVESKFLADVDLDEEVEFLAGRITVNTEGMTCFNMREKPHDVDDDPPTDSADHLVEFYLDDLGKEPRLIVTVLDEQPL